jgi:hypothetical protein
VRTGIVTFAHTYGIEGPCSISQVLASANGAVKRYLLYMLPRMAYTLGRTGGIMVVALGRALCCFFVCASLVLSLFLYIVSGQ